MRFKIIPTLLVAVSAILLFASCSKTNTEGRYIPNTAAVVVHVNGESIMTKLPWEEIKENELFKAIYADSNLSAMVKSTLDNPDNSGIDIKKDLVFFMEKDSTGEYIAIEGTIKDGDKFKAYNTDALKDAVASEKEGIQFLVNKRVTVSWDKTKFIVIADLPKTTEFNKLNRFTQNDDSADASPVKVSRDGISTALSIYNLKEGNSMAKEEKFSELVNTKGDVHFYMNAENLYADLPGMAAMTMVNISKIFEGSVTTAALNFDNGQINVDAKYYSGKEMSALWKKYSGSNISSDMVKRLPSKDIALFFAMNFKPEGIKEFVKMLGMEGLANMGTAKLGFNLDDFVKANKGDILLAVSDIKKDSSGKTAASFLFSASVGDKASFDKLVNAGKKMGKSEIASSKTFFNQTDKYFAIGNNKANIDQFITKEGNSQFDFFDKIASSPLGGFVNLQYIMHALRDEASKDSLGLVALDASIKMWDNIIVSGGAFKSGAVNQHIEINLVDKSSNSLKQLNKYMGILGKIAKEKKIEHNFTWDDYKPDVEPAVVTEL